MKFITPTLLHSRTRKRQKVHIIINKISFFHLRTQGNGTIVMFDNDNYVEISESPEDFSNRVKEALHEN